MRLPVPTDATAWSPLALHSRTTPRLTAIVGSVFDFEVPVVLRGADRATVEGNLLPDHLAGAHVLVTQVALAIDNY